MRIGKEKGVPISPELIGLFFEDINFAADGGLYAEMIENRSFEAREAYGNPGRFYAVDDPGDAWKSVQPDKPKGRGKSMQFPPVKEAALEHGIEVYQPRRVREPECVEL